jgi:hypothetical protein
MPTKPRSRLKDIHERCDALWDAVDDTWDSSLPEDEPQPVPAALDLVKCLFSVMKDEFEHIEERLKSIDARFKQYDKRASDLERRHESPERSRTDS